VLWLSSSAGSVETSAGAVADAVGDDDNEKKEEK